MTAKASSDWAPDYIRCLFTYKNGKWHMKCISCASERMIGAMSKAQKDFQRGKDISKCFKCRDLKYKLSEEELLITGVIVDNIYQTIDGNVWVGKWCESCSEYKQVRVSSIKDASRKNVRYTTKCKDCNYTGRIVTSGGYIRLLCKNHPFADSYGYVAEHRLVIEEFIGRHLYSFETVHHKNGIKDDNRLENLQLRSGQHGRGIVSLCGDCGSSNIEYKDL